jgi:hypothetical protein
MIGDEETYERLRRPVCAFIVFEKDIAVRLALNKS